MGPLQLGLLEGVRRCGGRAVWRRASSGRRPLICTHLARAECALNSAAALKPVHSAVAQSARQTVCGRRRQSAATAHSLRPVRPSARAAPPLGQRRRAGNLQVSAALCKFISQQASEKLTTPTHRQRSLALAGRAAPAAPEAEAEGPRENNHNK